MSVLYHRKRERAFDLADRLTKATAIIGGSAAWAAVTEPGLVKWVAAIIAATATLSLVFGFSERSRKHSELAQKFCLLEASIVQKGERDFEERDVDQWQAEALRIEATEPPALSALVTLCQNELAIARNQPEAVVPVTFWRRALAPLFDISAGPPGTKSA
jgi:hypothetical protein